MLYSNECQVMIIVKIPYVEINSKKKQLYKISSLFVLFKVFCKQIKTYSLSFS